MAKYKIYHSNGQPLKNAGGSDVYVRSLEYNGEWMGACNVSVDVESESSVDFHIGDYIEYRGERFEINYDPGKIKKAPRNTLADGFKYSGVVFNGYGDELVRSEFLDVVLSDNQSHYTALPRFAFYVQSLDDIADRLQANMDEIYGNGSWHFYTRNKKKSVEDRGCDGSIWDSVYGDEDNVEDNTIESTSLSVSDQTCWDVLGLVNSQFDVNFIIRERNVYIGAAGADAAHIFKYGKGNGLYEIEESTDSSQSVITRLRGYGNTTNMPVRYYAEVGATCVADITSKKELNEELVFCELELDMQFNPAAFTQRREYVTSAEQTTPTVDNSYVVKVTADGITEITGHIWSVDGKKSQFYSEVNSGLYDTGDEPSRDNLLAFIKAAKNADKIIFTSGVKRAKLPSKNIEYTSDLPNNMAIDRLMLPGFPNMSLQQWWDNLSKSEEGKKKQARLNPTGAQLTFSTDKYRPYVESPNAAVIGVRPASVFFDNDNEKEGLKDIYPTIEGLEVNGERIDEIETGSEESVTDDGVYKEGESVPNFDIYLKSAIDFDIATLLNDDFAIEMKDGMCGGRKFNVSAATKGKDGRWKLRLEREKDSSLNLYFPYKDFPIRKGDKFVLTGMDFPESYVTYGSEELLRYTITKLLDNDYTRKVYTPKLDSIFMARQNDEAEETGGKSLYKNLKEGDIFYIKDEDLGLDSAVTIEKLSIKESDGNIPEYDITLKDEKEVGTIQKIQNQVSSIVSGTSGKGGYSPSMIESMVTEIGKNHYLSKTSQDTARGIITFLKGIVLGTGHKIDEEGKATLDSVLAEALSRFAGGAEFGEYIQGILYGTGGRVDERGNAEFESITSRSSIIAKELIVNRQQAMEGNFMFTESGSVESVTEIPPATEGDNTTYELKLKKRWDGDFTAFHEQDCVLASVNTLMENGQYYDSWFRVLSVNTVSNTISVVMYPDNEVPSGKNYPPTELARLIRWGNPIDETRQSCWYISSENGLLVWLDHVTKPIIDKTNYSVAIGKLPDALSFVFKDFPQADKRDGAFYAKWLAVQNIINVDYEGNVQQNVIDRGLWSQATAESDKPYRATATEVHDVWKNGCRWRCLEDKTQKAPKYASTGWAFVEGNPEFTCRITGADQVFDADRISTRNDKGEYDVFTTLSVKGYLYNEDITENILAQNIVWIRDTGNTNEDNIWAIEHAQSGFNVPLTWDDLGTNAEERLSCTFKVEVSIIDEAVTSTGVTKTIRKATDETTF